MAVGVWPAEMFVERPLLQIALLSFGVLCIVLAAFLWLRRAWARPAAQIYHLWFGGILLLTALRPASVFATLTDALPIWLTTDTWLLLVRFVFVMMAAVSLVLAYLLDGQRAWDSAATQTVRRQRGSICPTCGATMQPAASGGGPGKAGGDPVCGYCTVSARDIYFLQPVLRNARRVLLLFEPGHERIRIGRGVGNGEAWIDVNENKRYRTISRHHADIELSFKTGQLTLHKAFTGQEVLVDNRPVLMSTPVQPGSLIQLGKVQFILGNSEYEPTLAYFVDQRNEKRRHLLRLNGLANEQKIGRAPDNDIVLGNLRDIDHHHATIIYDNDSAMFFIRNDAERNPVYIDGHRLEPGRTTQLSTDELIIVQLGAHNFNFLPVLYQPAMQEVLDA